MEAASRSKFETKPQLNTPRLPGSAAGGGCAAVQGGLGPDVPLRAATSPLGQRASTLASKCHSCRVSHHSHCRPNSHVARVSVHERSVLGYWPPSSATRLPCKALARPGSAAQRPRPRRPGPFRRRGARRRQPSMTLSVGVSLSLLSFPESPLHTTLSQKAHIFSFLYHLSFPFFPSECCYFFLCFWSII